MALTVKAIFAILAIAGMSSGLPLDGTTSLLAERQFEGNCGIETYTKLVGDGSPTQKYLWKDISEMLYCDSQSCSVGQSQTQSYSIGWSATADVDWISGGFDVEQSWETGNDYTCNGGPGDIVCIWYVISHTAYTVQQCTTTDCGWSETCGDPITITSPNANNVEGGMKCEIASTHECSVQGSQYWGGPVSAGQ